MVGVALLLAGGGVSPAAINPSLQPDSLFERHQAVLVGEIVNVKDDGSEYAVGLTSVLKAKYDVAGRKGEYKVGDSIVIAAGEDVLAGAASAVRNGSLRKGATWVAFAGKAIRRHEDEYMLYTSAGWGLGKMLSHDRWEWSATEAVTGTAGDDLLPLAATWSGAPQMLAGLLDDIVADRDYFPRKAYCRFREELCVLAVDAPIGGVAMYDIDGDGRLDIYFCSAAGNEALIQVEPDEGRPGFAVGTEHLGLTGVKSASCSFADVNADGIPDLLAGGALYVGGSDLKGRYSRSKLLPDDANRDVKMSAFVELNGDGYPDVLLASTKGGLLAYLNPGAKGGAFVESTADLGLIHRDLAQTPVLFSVGDWDGDDDVDLFVATRDGLLLVQDKGKFHAVGGLAKLNLLAGPDKKTGLTGGAAFASLLSPQSRDLVIPVERAWHLIANRNDTAVDVSGWAGELTEGAVGHLATATADLDADGRPDLYTISSGDSGQNRLILNRGYGMFMHAIKNPAYDAVVPGLEESAHHRGATGVAIGDLDGDGAPDVLLGNTLGEITVLINGTLDARAKQEAPVPKDLRRLADVRVVEVRVAGRTGVLNAVVTLLDSGGQPVGRHMIGSDVATGCRAPDRALFAVRTPGTYTVRVRYSDGKTVTQTVAADEPRALVTISRDSPATSAATAPGTQAATHNVSNKSH
jgi:hypothetical protein